MEQIKLLIKDAIIITKLLNKGFKLNEVTAKTKDGFLYISTVEPNHVMFANIKTLVGAKNKSIKINFANSNKIKVLNEDVEVEIVIFNVEETDEVTEYKFSYENFNKFEMEIEEFMNLIRTCEIMDCDYLRIVDDLIIGYNFDEGIKGRTRIIKEIKPEIKQENNDILIEFDYLRRLNEFLKEFNQKEKTLEFYFGMKNGEPQPIVIKIERSEYPYKNEFEIYITPKQVKQLPPIIDPTIINEVKQMPLTTEFDPKHC
jgi:hypothetical protein